MSARIVAAIGDRQRAAVAHAITLLRGVPLNDEDREEEKKYERAQDMIRALEGALRATPAGLLRLDEVQLPVDLAAPTACAARGMPLWIVETEGWGWVAVRTATDHLQAVLSGRGEVWGTMDGTTVSVRPLGRSALVLPAGGKAEWWAWAAAEMGRLLVADA